MAIEKNPNSGGYFGATKELPIQSIHWENGPNGPNGPNGLNW